MHLAYDERLKNDLHHDLPLRSCFVLLQGYCQWNWKRAHTTQQYCVSCDVKVLLH